MATMWEKIRTLTPRKALRYLEYCLVTAPDVAIDLLVCGRVLAKSVPSPFHDDRRGVGMTASQPAHYAILRRILGGVELTESDSFLDVGCGKGRVLAYMLRRKCPCKISGIELSEEPARVASEWVTRYPKVEVIRGDALQLDYSPYTALFLSRPFLPKTFLEFVDRLEATVGHRVTLVYWVDQQSGHLLRGRSGWTMLRHGTLYKVHGLRIAGSPQGWSVWEYEPVAREALAGE